MNRTDRLSAILILLQTKKIVKASDIAERFEISLRTVYRDIKALDEAGVPIGAEAGVGYYLVEGYHLPPVMFTPEEAGSLLIAGKLVQYFSDESVRQNFNMASDKIKSVLPEGHQEFLGEMEQHVHVFHTPAEKSEIFTNNFLTRVQKAISAKKCIALNYFSQYRKEDTCRIVEPIGLCFYGFKWHLIAYCQLRRDYRDFRLDRVKSLEIDAQTISSKAGISISDYFSYHWNEEDLMQVTVRFDKSISRNIANSKYYFGFYEEEQYQNEIIMRFAVNDIEYMGNWLLSLGKKST
jgi:predicted DNA-binding transcriptional regulator YafY